MLFFETNAIPLFYLERNFTISSSSRDSWESFHRGASRGGERRKGQTLMNREMPLLGLSKGH